MILTNTGVLKLMQRIKSFITAQLNTKANSVHTHTISEIDDLSSLQMGGGYSKSEVDTLLNGKADTGHTHTVSDVTDFPTLSTVATSGSYNDLSNKPTIPIVDSALSSTSTNALQNKVINTELSKKANTTHTHTVSDVTDFPSLATVATSGSYNDLSNKPATMTPTSHTHGNITNDGKIGSNANKPLITTTGGTVTTGSFGTTANTFCEGNDSRLSDARTPTAHTHTVSDVTDFPNLSAVATSGSYNDLSNKPTIPTVNNATLTIQKNGTTVKTFTANASSNVTANISVPTKTSDLTNDSGFLTSADLLPTGSYIQFAGSQAPEGFLVCNGGEISRTTYSALFAVIGTTYGSGDGSTTFNLPNLTDRFLQGSTTSGTVKNAGLPNITGSTGTIPYIVATTATGSLIYTESGSNANLVGNPPGTPLRYLDFDASRSSSIYGSSSTVQPPALTCLICIKY